MRLIRAATRQARKPCRCVQCGGRILVGQQYERELWDDDGKVCDERYHTRCPGESESRQQRRASLLDYLTSDPG